MWRNAGIGHGIQIRHAWAFAGGWLALVLALVSPLDRLGAWLFSAHMVQHELLMIVAAPLLVMGRPLAVWTWAMPLPWRMRFHHVTGGARATVVIWGAITAPLAAWSLHALALWLWHVPALFDAALTSRVTHTLQHLSFFLTALLFWWAVLVKGRKPGQGGALLYPPPADRPSRKALPIRLSFMWAGTDGRSADKLTAGQSPAL